MEDDILTENAEKDGMNSTGIPKNEMEYDYLLFNSDSSRENLRKITTCESGQDVFQAMFMGKILYTDGKVSKDLALFKIGTKVEHAIDKLPDPEAEKC